MKNDFSIYGKMFYDFLEKHITPLLENRVVLFAEPCQSLKFDFCPAYIFFLLKPYKKNIIYVRENDTYDRKTNDLNILCRAFPDNDTFFELIKGENDDSAYDYVLIAHLDVNHFQDIQFIMSQASSLYLFDKPYEYNKSIYDYVRKELMEKSGMLKAEENN